jgi:hypothetical protein
MLAMLCGLMPFIRPELGALALLLIGRQIWLRKDMQQATLDIFIAGIVAAPWLAWLYSQTGTMFPSTAGAKSTFFGETDLPLAIRLRAIILGVIGGLGILPIALIFVWRIKFGRVLLSFLAIFLVAYFIQLPGGLAHNFYRYPAILLPICVWALCQIQRPLLLIACAIVAVVSFGLAVRQFANAAVLSRDGLDAGAWAQANIPTGSRVLIHDAGEIAFASRELKLIDVVGLKRPASVEAHRRFTAPSAGADRWKAIDLIARRSGAQYAEIADIPFWRDIAADLRKGGWRLGLLRKTSISGGYNIYRLTP